MTVKKPSKNHAAIKQAADERVQEIRDTHARLKQEYLERQAAREQRK